MLITFNPGLKLPENISFSSSQDDHLAKIRLSFIPKDTRKFVVWDGGIEDTVRMSGEEILDRLVLMWSEQGAKNSDYFYHRSIEPVQRLAAVRKRPDIALEYLQTLNDIGHPRPRVTTPTQTAEQVKKTYGSGLPLLALSRSLFKLPIAYTTRLYRQLESFMDTNSELHGHHPNLAEFFLMLNHPQMLEPRKKSADFIDVESGIFADSLFMFRGSPLSTASTSITSIFRWRSAVPYQTFLNWRNVGSLTHSFKPLKFYTQRNRTPVTGEAGTISERITPSLIEEFGFERIPDRETDKPFGPAYERPAVSAPKPLTDDEIVAMIGSTTKSGKRSQKTINGQHPGFGPGYKLVKKPTTYLSYDSKMKPIKKPFDQNMYIEFRRGYYLASHPEYGTLIIRNSSPDFGRDCMAAPAYYSTKGINNGFTETDLQEFSFTHPKFAVEMKNIGKWELNSEVGNALPENTKLLLDHVLGVRDAFRRAVFDTGYHTAWRRVEGQAPVLRDKGGYKAPMFKSLLQFLTERFNIRARVRHMNRTEKLSPRLPLPEMPSLAFVSTTMPLAQPFRIEGTKRRTFRVTKKRLKVLNALANLGDKPIGPKLQNAMTRTGVQNFLQTGFINEGELIMVSPNNRRTAR